MERGILLFFGRGQASLGQGHGEGLVWETVHFRAVKNYPLQNCVILENNWNPLHTNG